MAIKTPAQLQADYQANLPDNTSSLIDPADTRNSFVDTTDSWDALKVDNTQDAVNRWNANKLQNENVDPTPPTDQQILVFNNSSGQWEPTAFSTPVTDVGLILYADNATVTTITAVDTPVLVDPATFTSVRLVNFNQDINGRLEYTGLETKDFVISASICLFASSNSRLMTMYLAKNGSIINDTKNSNTTAANECTETSTFYINNISTSDYFELFVENNENTDDITVADAKLMLKEL